MKKDNSWILSLLIIVFILIFTPLFGVIYERIIGRIISSGFIGYGHPEYFEGLFMSYAFFISFILVIFNKSKKYLLMLILILILLFLDIILGAWQNLIINLVTAIIGWLLGEGILRIYKTLKK